MKRILKIAVLSLAGLAVASGIYLVKPQQVHADKTAGYSVNGVEQCSDSGDSFFQKLLGNGPTHGC